MDLTRRKYNFIEKFIQIANPEKIKRLEAALNETLNEDDAIVAYTVAGEPLNAEHYKKRIKEADEAISRGEFTTQEDLEKEVDGW